MPTSVSIPFDESILASSVTATDLGISGTCTGPPTVSVTGVVGSVVTFALGAATGVDGQTVNVTSLGATVTDLFANPGLNLRFVSPYGNLLPIAFQSEIRF